MKDALRPNDPTTQRPNDVMDHDDLLARYVEAFGVWDDMTCDDAPAELTVSVEDDGWRRWRPVAWAADPTALVPFYHALDLSGVGGERFPRLYERLILSYRWLEVELDCYRLIANPPAPDLAPLAANMTRDPHLRETLLAHGFHQFSKGPDNDYDPICFDLNAMRGGDCPIVKFDHEEILCNSRIRKVADLAPGFRELVAGTVAGAKSVRR